MLSRKYRFQGLGSVRPTMRHGSTARSAGFSLKKLTNSHYPHPRLAVIVSKKVSKKAVVRNRIRRRIYAALEDAIMQQAPETDVVVIAYSEDLAERDFSVLQNQLTDALKK